MRGIVLIATITSLWWTSFGADLHLQDTNRALTRAFENTILAALECFREKLSTGVPELNIPSFNPLEIQEKSIDLSALNISVLQGHANIKDLMLAETTNWQVTKLKGTISIIPPRYIVSMTLNFPQIVFKSLYDLDAVYSEHRAYGVGSASFEMVNFSVDVNIKVRILGGIAFDYFHAIPHLEALKSFEITGLMSDEELSSNLSQIITANASQILNGLAEEIDKVLGNIILGSVNNGGNDGAVSELLKQCL